MCSPSGSISYLSHLPVDGPGAGDHLSVSRTLCGALIFPSVASLVGRLLFRRVSSNLQRTVLVNKPEALWYLQQKDFTFYFTQWIYCALSPQGGIAFVLIKGVLKVYFKQQQCIIQASRHILNYPETHRDRRGGEDETDDSGHEWLQLLAKGEKKSGTEREVETFNMKQCGVEVTCLFDLWL